MRAQERILVVDDDEDLRDLLEAGLSSKGYAVRTAADGEAALAMLKTDPVDLVLLDVMLPGMDGYHVAHELSRTMGREAPKILILTGRNVKVEAGVGFMSGARSMIQKPFSMDDLGAKVEEIMSNRASDHGGGAGADRLKNKRNR